MPKGIRSLANGGPPNPFGGPAITGGGGITPIKMPAAQVRFPTARGPVRRAPAPTTKEILGPLLGFGANSLLSGLGGLFGKDEPETADEYLKSIGVEEAAIEDKSLLSEIDRAQYDAYRIYGAPTKKDSFGLDEIANLAIASQMDRGGPGYIKGVLDSKKATESDRLNTQVKRQAYVNELLKPVDRTKVKVLDPGSGTDVYVNSNKRSGKFEAIEGLKYPEGFNIDLVRPTIDDGTYANPAYYHLPTFNKGDVGGAIHTSKVNNKTGDVEIRMKDGTYIYPGDEGYTDYVPVTAVTESQKAGLNLFGTPQAAALVKKFETLRERDASSFVLMALTNEYTEMVDKNIASGGKLNPLTAVSEGFEFINKLRNNLEVATKNLYGDQDSGVNRLFSRSQYGGFREDTKGYGQASSILYNEFADLDSLIKDYPGKEKETNEKISNSISTWLDNADLNPARRESLRTTFRGMKADQMRMAAIQIQMAYTAAAVNGQTGRTLSDKDLAYHLQMIGFDGSNDLALVKNTMLKFMDSTIKGVGVAAGTSFSKSAVATGVVDIENPNIQSMYETYWDIPDEYLNFTDPSRPNGIPIRGTDRNNPYNINEWTLKSMFQRSNKNPVMQKYLGFKGERISEKSFYDRRADHPEIYLGYEDALVLDSSGINLDTNAGKGLGFNAVN